MSENIIICQTNAIVNNNMMLLIDLLKETLNNHQSGSWLQKLSLSMKVYFVV